MELAKLTEMKKRLDQYIGHLKPDQIAAGINAANKNAVRLVSDAKLLADAKRYPSAVSLAILAIEECGKVSILRELSYAQDLKAIKEAWRRYRSHTAKNAIWIAPEMAAHGARVLEDFSKIFDMSADHPFVLNQLKQISFYTDCLGNAHWSLPSEVINEELALAIIKVADILSKEKLVTTEEVELWIKYMGPVLREPKSESQVKKAFGIWYRAAVERGFMSDSEIARNFIFGESKKEKH